MATATKTLKNVIKTEASIKEQTAQVLKQSGLDWYIEKLPMVGLRQVEGIQGIVPCDSFGLYNSQTYEILNIVKGSYRVSQNDEVIELALRGMQNFGELSISKAGELHGGRKVYIQLAVKGDAKVGNDTIKRFVTITDSNDGSTGLSVGIGDLTMSCSNQFFKFYKAGRSKLKHTASMDKKIKELPGLIESALQESMKQIEVYNKFASTPITRDLAHKMVNHLLGVDRLYTDADVLAKKNKLTIEPMDKLYEHIEKEINGKGLNLWGLHSGVTSWTTHDKQAPARPNGQLESLMIGTNYDVNQESLQFCAEFAELELVN